MATKTVPTLTWKPGAVKARWPTSISHWSWTLAYVMRRSLPWTAPLNWALFFPAYGNRGIAYSVTEEIRLAVADYSKAIKLNPTYSLSYRNRGSAYLLRGELELAIADLARTVELGPGNSTAYISREVDDYTLAIVADPTSLNAYLNRGSAYGRRGRYAEAVIDYGNALHPAPDSPTVYTNHGAAPTPKTTCKGSWPTSKKPSPLARLPSRPGTTWEWSTKTLESLGKPLKATGRPSFCRRITLKP